MKKRPLYVLIIGSAPSAMAVRNWDLSLFEKIVVINNAWKITKFWTNSIFPEDFPMGKRPIPNSTQNVHSAEDYVYAQNHYGGFVYAGGTMAFTSAYWSLYEFEPSLIAYIGCDMIYSGTKTHFYGKGTPDPLRNDITLKNLRAKSARFEAIATRQKCAVVNLSNLQKSNLVHRRFTLDDLTSKTITPKKINEAEFERVVKLEKKFNYFVPSGRYWEKIDSFKAEKISIIDDLWIKTLNPD